jgi:nuclear RNA export factor
MKLKVYLFRCFIVVPQGAGFCIVNETLYVCQATVASSKKAFVTPDCTVASVVTKSAASTSGAAAPSLELDLASKQTLATAFAAKSGMNLEWSAKCLQENAWDFDKSATVFFELKAAGKIPPEAFL